jgi:hypothetical protein
MTSKRIEAERFLTANSLYGAIIEETQQLVFVLEAGDAEEAAHRVKSVLPYCGVKEQIGINLVDMLSCPVGVPSFLNAFFSGAGLGAVRNSVAPSTETRH